MPFDVGDPVHLAGLGKAVVREVRGRGRYLVELKGRMVLAAETQLTLLDRARLPERREVARGAMPDESVARPGDAAAIDLHGLTVAEALSALDRFLNEAMLASLEHVRVIHGRSGGRVRGAVHAHLRQLPSVRAFRLDPRNPGVTLVFL